MNSSFRVHFLVVAILLVASNSWARGRGHHKRGGKHATSQHARADKAAAPSSKNP